jgi:hypothetical protein
MKLPVQCTIQYDLFFSSFLPYVVWSSMSAVLARENGIWSQTPQSKGFFGNAEDSTLSLLYIDI